MKELNHHKQALERASENSEANEKISRPGGRRPVRPLTQTGQTGRAGIEIPDRSDGFHRLVRPVAPRQPTNKASNVESRANEGQIQRNLEDTFTSVS